MKPEEARKMSLEELKVADDQLRRRLFQLRSQAVTEKLENPRELRHLRRDIARIQTELTQRTVPQATKA